MKRRGDLLLSISVLPTSKAKMAVPKNMGNWRPEVNQGTLAVLGGMDGMGRSGLGWDWMGWQWVGMGREGMGPDQAGMVRIGQDMWGSDRVEQGMKKKDGME